jgi:hypothetical protein
LSGVPSAFASEGLKIMRTLLEADKASRPLARNRLFNISSKLSG